MESIKFLKIIKSVEKEQEQICLNPLTRFKGLVLSLTEDSIRCLGRVFQKELEKESPSSEILEEYHLLNHYLCFLKNLCKF